MTSMICDRVGNFFSQERFVEAVARAEGGRNVRVLKIQSGKSPAHIFGLERIHKFNIRSVSLAPFALPAYPTEYDPSRDRISELVRQLQTIRTLSFDWNVRFDHQDFAKELIECGLKSVEWTTQVLYLDRCYDALFRNFTASTRNQIRRSEREGVFIRHATKYSDLKAYYTLYEKVIRERQWTDLIYNLNFLEEILRLSDNVILLIAEFEEKMIGGGWYVRDGNSLFYWQSAINRKYKHYFPMYAITNYAIRLACHESMASFNMGGSGGLSSLEQFKSFWGARKVPLWGFVWKNPLLSPARRVFSKTRRILGRPR
jgi:lipid II:glycine glycyltransferase (peptidoglycan interpeptide bridge formation enzyme)